MPSNDDFKKQILELDKEANVEDLNNAELAALLSKLKADPNAGAQDASDKKSETRKAREAEVKTAKKPPFYLAEGKSLTTKRGILAEGDEIKAGDLAGGKSALDNFVKSGHVKKA